jgi:hypothetical protein
MPARAPDATRGQPQVQPSTVAKAAPKQEPPSPELQPLAGSLSDNAPARHAALLADPRIQNGAGDGQAIRLLQALQRTHGNAHVAAVIAQLKEAEAAKRNGNGTPAPPLSVQLQAATACPAPPREPVAAPPEQDPSFRAVEGDVKKGATTLKRHEPAKKKVTEAQDAAKAPPDDIESQSKAAKTDTMSAAKPGTFDKAAFMAAVRQAIAAKAPKNLDEADKFASSGNAGVKAEVTGKVTQSKEGATKDVKQKTEAPPDPSKAKPKEVKPAVEEKPGSRPPDPAAAKAMPSPAPPEEKNLGAGKCEVDSQMKEADVTDEQLAKSNEPEFTGALEDKKQAEEHAATAPAKVEQQEKAILDGAKKGATADAKSGVTAMFGVKKEATDKVGVGKTKAQSKDEAERAKVSGEIKAIYDRTEKDVKGIIDGLDKKVDAAFDKGEAEAKSAFTQRHESEMKAYKKKRYSGVNFWKWGKDKLMGLPEEANQIYIRARDMVYLPKMDKVISDVADIVGSELTRAKQRIEQGRAEIKKYVSGLPASLKKYGAEAQKEFTAKFDELEKSVDDKQSELVDKLATKYVEARNKVDEEIKKMQEANKGLVDKVKDAIGGVIKTILELKNMLMGVLARAASVVGKIIKDPIGFLGNLISGIKGGLQAFIGNIAEHLKKGLVGWLLGNMRSAGLELPAKFDVKGIIGMIASLLGLTWAAIRGRVVQRGVPEQAMSAAEKAVPEAQALQREGVAGLWQRISEKVGDIKQMILGKLSEELIPTVFMAGITWIISLLNPASAFIKAVKAIIDIVRFIFQQAAQLAEFINAVLDAIIAIAGGAIGGAVKAIENALAKSIPVLIGFLAAILGIGGLAEKVKKIFQAVSKPVMKVVDKVVDTIVKAGKKLWAKLKGKGKGKKGEKRDGRNLKQKVREELRRRLRSPMQSPEEVRAILGATAAKYRKDGLQSLDVVNVSGKPGVFTVRATASPSEGAAQFRAVIGLDVGDVNFTSTRKRKVALTATLEKHGALGSEMKPLGKFESEADDKKRHAEEKLIQRLRRNWDAICEPSGKNILHIALTASPCPEKPERVREDQEGCADKLGTFLDELNKKRGHKIRGTSYGPQYSVELDIKFMSVHHAGAGSHYEQQSKARLERLYRKSGVTMSVWDVIAELREKGVDPQLAISDDGVYKKLEEKIKQAKDILDGFDKVKV